MILNKTSRHTPLYIEYHVIHMVPANCMNTDDTGSIKTVRFGGVTRQRASSQSNKHAVRDNFANMLDDTQLSYRTKQLLQLITDLIIEIDPTITEDDAKDMAKEVITATGIKLKSDDKTEYLVFISYAQAKALAELIVDIHADNDNLTQKELKERLKEAKKLLNVKQNPMLTAMELAMFGRMVANTPELKVDAAVQVAHMIGVEAYEPGFDYYTALDDLQSDEESGASMIGTIEFGASTMYKYSNLDVYHLWENSGSVKAVSESIKAYTKAYAMSLPTGKKNTFAHNTLPTAVLIQLRNTQPVSLATAFERPVYPQHDKAPSLIACERLVEQAKATNDAFCTTPQQSYVICASPHVNEVFADLDATQCNINEAAEAAAANAVEYLNSLGIADIVTD